jgi:ABC-type glutathione transport system ATPase component
MVSEVLFIGGRSGAGKSSVGMEIHLMLSAASVAHCVIDGDFLDMAYPAPREDDLAERNLAALCSNYRSLGYRRLIYMNTACVLPDETRKLADAVGHQPRIVAVLLNCSDVSAADRLSQREVGTGLDQHLKASRKMAALLQRSVAKSVHRITTDGRSVPEVAADVIARTDWLPSASESIGR